MSVSFSTEQMELLVAKAVIDSLTDEQRAAFIQSAIQKVLAKPRDGRGYGDQRSEFQIAFDNAVTVAANKAASAMLEDDESFQAQVRSLFADAAKKLFEEKRRDVLVTEIANLIQRGLTKDSY